MSPALLTTDLAAVAYNLRKLRRDFAPARTMLVVKADAYGHGLQDVARVAVSEGVSDFAVLDIETGLELREIGCDGTLFAWRLTPSDDFAAARRARIDLGVQSLGQLEAIAAAGPSEHSARVHLKLDTGLHRGGANPVEWDDLVCRAVALEAEGFVTIEGAWTHFSDNSMAEDRESLALFHRAVDRARELGASFSVLHAAASGAGIDFPESRMDFVRLGLGGYGISPFHDRSGHDLGLEPALALVTEVLAVDDETAVLDIGFGDGLQSAADATVWVGIEGARHDIISVGVDETIVRRAPGVAIQPGSLAYCFGNGEHGEPTAEQWADAFGTVPDEIVTGVTARVARNVVGQERTSEHEPHTYTSPHTNTSREQ